MPAKYEVTPITNVITEFCSPIIKVCLVKHSSTRKYYIGVWFMYIDTLYIMNVPSTPVPSPVDHAIHKKVMFDTNQYFFIEGKYEGSNSVPRIIVKKDAIVADPAPLSAQLLEVLGFQLNNIESTPEPSPVAQEEEKKEETELKEEKQPEPEPQIESIPDTDFGHLVLGKVVESVKAKTDVYIHDMRYTCPYDGKKKSVSLGCVITRKPGAQYNGDGISCYNMPSLRLFVSNGGQDLELLTTEIDAVCHTIRLTLNALPTLTAVTQNENIWFAENVKIQADGKITLTIINEKTRKSQIMYGRRTTMPRAYGISRSRNFGQTMQDTAIDFSKFVDGKLDLTTTNPNYLQTHIRLYMDEETFNSDAGYTTFV